MKPQFYLLELFALILSLAIINCSFINTKKSQLEYKKRKKFKKQKIKLNEIKNNESKKIKRKLDDDEDDDDEELTASVYNRCDNGHTPDDISDCTTHETEESSCCLFTYGQDTGCVLIGFKYLGSKTVGDMVVNCHSKRIEMFNFLFIIISFFLLF